MKTANRNGKYQIKQVVYIACLLLVGFGISSLVIAQEESPGSSLLKEAQRLSELKLENRIVDGTPIPLSERPWQVAIVLKNRSNNFIAHFCGGSLISKEWIITAAHCVDQGTLPSQIQILYGTNKLDSSGQRIDVVDIRVHSDWNASTKRNDVALLKVEGEISDQTPASIATAEELSQSSDLRLSGWGRIDQFGLKSESLLAATVPIQTFETCNQPESYNGRVTKEMFCAGKIEGGVDSCKGDSGGPATGAINGKAVLAGVISWGKGCALAKKYGVYTNLPMFLDWIISEMNS